MSFENSIYSKKENIPNLGIAYSKADKFLKKYRVQMSPETFKHYDQEQIRNDKLEVESFKENFNNNESKKMADVLEAIILEQIEMSDWFGGQANTIIASEYDDIKNGIDGIIEFIKEDNFFNYAGISIDITFAKNLDRKINRLAKEIKSGELGEIKYFKSEENKDICGSLKNIPKFVIGVSVEELKELTSRWLQANSKERNEYFANSEVQLNILEQILLQSKTFYEFTRYSQPEVAQKFDNTYNIFEKIYNEKKEILKRDEVNTKHKTYQELSTSLRRNIGFITEIN